MKLGLINSAWVQAQQPTVFGLRKTKEIGFDTIDVFVDPLDLDVRERRLIKTECDRLELPIVSLPSVAVGLIDFNPSVRAFHIQRAMAYLDLAYEFEARNVLLVIGEYIWNREVIPHKEQWQLGVNAVRALGQRAGELDLEIVLELEPFPLSLVNSVDTMVRFLEEVELNNVKANLDISHLVLSHVPAEEIRRLKGRVGHVHLSDCDGRVHGDLPPGRGVVQFEPYLREIKALALGDRTISIELEYAPQPEKIVEWVEEAYRETNKLMQNLALRH
ncbi:MAG TPA: sugar phosphate isomerase/epimerase [Pirellulales bacterium]|nr:sugar phosphate isomerase/epimerase [Pirellulales bacterium]